jgi:hypothetical protein
MVGVEILNRNLKMPANFEIKEAPALKEIVTQIDAVQHWPDKLVELELWSNLCILACKANQTELLKYCHSKALELLSYFEKRKHENKSVRTKYKW